jgi:methylthioribose-1-phosphate isomerase
MQRAASSTQRLHPNLYSQISILSFSTVDWSPDGAAVRVIDQRLLPTEFAEIDLRTLDAVCDAIRTLAVRGAPAIGVAGAMGLVVALAQLAGVPRAEFLMSVRAVGAQIVATRPTAVNLSWAIERMLSRADRTPGGAGEILAALHDEATCIRDEDRAMCERIGEHGVALLGAGANVLTHCNAGALATAGIGTALAPIYRAWHGGQSVHVYVDETRPLLQGSRLTAWELARAGIPNTVIADNMAASLMRAGKIDLCIVGADRIAANGDVANKIGTYGVALAAHHHNVPFYVAAPTSTFDGRTATGDGIVIEERNADEIRRINGVPTAPPAADVYNPAFDVTPAALVTAIISDRGIYYPPYDFSHPPA